MKLRSQQATKTFDPGWQVPLFCVMANVGKQREKRKAVLVGVGLDSDGHKRLTKGPNFLLVGGSKETHEVMTEKVIKINEKVTARGKELAEVSREEFDDIAHSVGLKQAPNN
jgi:hypothetical protein